MANVVPTGLPAWTHTASIEIYGGHTEKQNHLGGGVIDATTDVGAEDFSRLVGDLAATVRTAPFAVLKIRCNDASSTDPTILSARMMTGVNLVSYAGNAPPTGYPSAIRNGVVAGQFTLTFASTYADEYGVAGTFEITDAHGTVIGANNYVVACDITSPTTLEVRVLNGAVALGNQTITIVVG